VSDRTPAATGRRSRLEWLPALVVATGLPLLVMKGVLIAHNLSGAEGRTPAATLLAKSLLFLGWDVAGAVLVPLLLLGLVAWVPRRRDGLAAGLIAPLLTLHGWAVVMSGFVTIVMGAPATKATIDLGFLNSEPRPGVQVDTGALWNSIAHMATPFNLTLLFGLMLLPPLLFFWLRARLRLGPVARRVAIGVGGAFAATTIVILPNLINGEVLGIRVHTFGLERSAIVTLAASYARPLVRLVQSPPSSLGDPFCFDYGSVVAPGRVADAPLLSSDRREDGTGARPRRTNVVLVQLESMGSVSLGELPTAMPFLAGLGAPGRGVTLQAHTSPWPQTMKAVFSMVCGEMPYADYPPITSVNPSIPVTCLPDTLKSQGFRTGWFTSSDIAYDRQLRFLQFHHLDVIGDMYTVPGADKAWRNSWGVDERTMIDAVLGWIDQAPGQPFFVFYGQAAGHHPYVFAGGPEAPEPTVPAEHAAYLECARHVDDSLRRLVDGLKARGLLDDTLLVIASDHGEAFDQHGGRTHGNQIYEESVQVPAVMSGPQLTAISGPVSFPTSHMDLAPTILGLLGLEVPPTMKGRDLTREDDARLVLSGARPPAEQLGVRDGAWKAVVSLETGAIELFDLASDPGEQHSLTEQHADLAERMVARARAWQAHSRNLIENYAAIAAHGLKRCQPAATAPAKEPAP